MTKGGTDDGGMELESRFSCGICGDEHPGPPLAYASIAPGRWYQLDDAERARSTLDGELCVIESSPGERDFYIRANLGIPVNDGEPETVLTFSCWVYLSNAAMQALLERWLEPARVNDAAYEGTLANDLPGYPSTIGLPVEVHTLEPGKRSRAVMPPTEHLLAIDHWEGITHEALQDLAEQLAHPESR